MAAALGLEAVADILDAAASEARALHPVAANGQGGGDDWNMPLPLGIPVASELYPSDALPDVVRGAVEEVQAFTQAPLALVACSALGALSLTGQAYVDVKRAEGLTGPTSLFLLTIADSGERKSTCDQFFTQPIHDYERQQTEAMQPALSDYRAALTAWESNIAGVKDGIRLQAKKGQTVENQREALRRLEDNRPVPPRVPRLLRLDETPENLAWVLAREWPAAGGDVRRGRSRARRACHGEGLHHAQSGVAEHPVGMAVRCPSDGARPSHSRCKGPVSRSPYRFRKPRCGASLSAPAGLLVAPDSWPAFCSPGQSPPRGSACSWSHPPTGRGCRHSISVSLSYWNSRRPLTSTGHSHPSSSRSDPNAKRVWIRFHDDVERQLCTDGELADVRDVASKAADNAARLAALFHAVESGPTGAVGPKTLEDAARVVAWHLNEARRVCGDLTLPPELTDAERLDRWLVNYCRARDVQVVPRRELQRNVIPVRLRKGTALDAALKALEEAHRVRHQTTESAEGHSDQPGPAPGGAGVTLTIHMRCADADGGKA